MASKNSNRHEHLDSLAKKTVKAVEEFIPTQSKQEYLWKKICERLDNMDKKILSWFMLSTISLTMLVAAGLEYANTNRLLLEKEELSNHQQNSRKITNNPTIQLSKIISASPDLPKANNTRSSKLNFSKLSKAMEKEVSLVESLLDSQKTSSYKTIRTNRNRFHIYGTVSRYNQSFSPELGITMDWLTKIKSNKLHRFSSGVSIQYTRLNHTLESKNNVSRLYGFIHMNYETVNLNTSKGWGVNAGYLINPDQTMFKGHSVKLALSRKINRHLKVGPEIYFTNGFKSFYPGLSFTISS